MTLSEAKHQCGIAEGVDYFNIDLLQMISSARQIVEADTGIVFYTGAHTYKLTQWPPRNIELPLRPVSSITSITYLDTAGASQTLSSSVYSFQSDAVRPYITLAYGQTWPALRGDVNGITITLVAGYATVLAINQKAPSLKRAVLLLLKHWFDNRGIVSTGSSSPDISETYQALINRHMRTSYP